MHQRNLKNSDSNNKHLSNSRSDSNNNANAGTDTDSLTLPLDTANLERTLSYLEKAKVLAQSNNYEEAIEWLEKAGQVYSNYEQWESCVQTYNRIGQYYMELTRYDESLNYLKSSLGIGVKYLDNAPSVSQTCDLMAQNYIAKGDHTNALNLYQQGLRIRLKKIGTIHPDIAQNYYHIGQCFLELKLPTQALSFFQRTLTDFIELKGEQDPFIADIYTEMSECYKLQDKHSLALSHLEEALQARIRSGAEDSTEMAETYQDLGLNFYDAADYKKAIPYLEESLAIQRRLLGEEHAEIAQVYNELGFCYLAIGSHLEAIFYHQKALAIKINELGEQANTTAEIYDYIAICYEQKKDYDTAINYLKRALKIYQLNPKEKQGDIIATYREMGNCYAQSEAYKDASKYYQKSVAAARQLYGENAREVAQVYNSWGALFTYQKYFDPASNYHHKALSVFNQLPDNEEDILQTYICFARLYQAQGNLDAALEYAQKGLVMQLSLYGAIHPNTAANYNRIGGYLSEQGNNNEALDYLEQALNIRLAVYDEFNLDTATTYANMGTVYQNMSAYADALNSFQQSLSIRLRLLNDIHPDLAFVYSKLAACNYFYGDYENALIYLQKAVSSRLENYGEEHATIVQDYNLMGRCFLEKNDYKQALHYSQKAVDISEQIFEEAHPIAGESYNTLGHYYVVVNNYDTAIQQFTKALDIYLHVYGTTHPETALIYSNLGIAFIGKKEAEKGLNYHRKALDIRTANFGKKHPAIADSYSNIGGFYVQQKDYQEALEFYQKAIIALFSDYADTNVYKNPELGNYSSALKLLEVLRAKAATFEKIYALQTQSGNLLNLEVALETYMLAADLIDQMMQGYKTEGAKLLLARKAVAIYDKTIEVAYELNQITEIEDYLHDAFRYSEKGKGIVLFSHLREADAKAQSTIPPEVLAEEQRIRREMNQIDRQIDAERSRKEVANIEQISEWEAQYFQLTQAYTQLIDQLEAEYPEYYNLKFRTDPVTIVELQEILPQQTDLISYFIGSRHIYIFVLKQASFRVLKVGKPIDFESQIADFTETIEDVSRKMYIRLAAQLYQTLIAPIGLSLDADKNEDLKRRLIIIPDDELAYVPFETFLYKAATTNVRYADLPYFIHQYNISYHYSATLMHYTKMRQAAMPEQDDSFLGLAPVYSKKLNQTQTPIPLETTGTGKLQATLELFNKKYQELIYSKYEVMHIGELFEEQGIPSKTLYHTKASKKIFLAQTPYYKYIHIAAHGLQNKAEPALSGIIFHPEKDANNTEDAIFYISDAYHLHLCADLMVLSTCESGIGNLVKGEGIMTINRGFLYSGAANLIFTLFKVYDLPSFQLTQVLYKGILDGLTYEQALRKAKQALIKMQDTTPLSWGGFVLIGG